MLSRRHVTEPRTTSVQPKFLSDCPDSSRPRQSVVAGGRLFQNKKHASMMRISVQSKVCGVETNDQSEVCRVGTIGDSTVGRQYSYLGPLSPSP